MSPSSIQEPVNVICLKWGTVYSADYVNHLYTMVARHLSLPFRFICFTEQAEGINEAIEIWPLPEFEEPPWEYARYCPCWRKLALFKPGLAEMTGKVLFLDLDVVITGSLDCFFNYTDKLAIIENWYQPNRLIGQASAICFEAGQPYPLLENYLADPLKVLKAYRTEQAYITGQLGEGGFEFFPDTWCRSFKKHCLPGGLLNAFQTATRPPDDARIVVFHGCPNPPDAIAGKWGKKVPWYKRLYKTVKPTPWVADYWR